MKSLYFTEDHTFFRQTVRQFIETEVVPHADEWEKAQKIPRHIWKRMGELGFLGINLPEIYGGSEADLFFSVVFLEEISRCYMGGFAAAVSVHEYMAIAHLAKAGSHELKQKYLAPSIAGDMIGALAISEPSGGSDVSALRTTAVREGDEYVINGNKTFITNGVYSDFIVTACRTSPGKGVQGISLIIVDRNTPGVSANKLDKIGWNCSDTGEIFYENVRVPASNLIGKEGMGFYYIMESFQLERLVGGIMGVGGAEHTLEVTLQYMREREAFGRPINRFQVLRHRIANLATEIEAARQLTYHTCWLYANNQYAVKEASMVKLYCSELAKKVADECLQCFGGYGYMNDFPIARIYRDARAGTIVAGTSEIMREIIAKIVVDDVSYQSAYKGGQKTTKEEAPLTAIDIIRSLPKRLKAEKVNGFSTVCHFALSGENGGDFTVTIADGTCEVRDGHEGEAACLIEASAETYAQVELGKMNPQAAIFSGKIKISNLAVMMKFSQLFKRISA